MTVLAIVGPTAVGKSALAVAVARRCRGEIINIDSMQIYIGMNIGTATPSVTERAGVAHHLVDIWPPDHELAVAEYQQVARLAIDDVISRGAQPIVVGGSGLYVMGVLDDLQFPGTDPVIRANLEAQLEAEGPAQLHARLVLVDPVAAAAILPTKPSRSPSWQAPWRRCCPRPAGWSAALSPWPVQPLRRRCSGRCNGPKSWEYPWPWM